jgi:predicted amidophosphoribosyltransferase
MNPCADCGGGGLPGTEKPIPLAGGHFSGFALRPHTVIRETAAGALITKRSELGELLHRYRYQGEGALCEQAADWFERAIAALFPGKPFDLILMTPVPVTRPDYARVVELATGLSRRTGVPSGQFAVTCTVAGPPKAAAPRREPERKFAFSSPTAAGIFAGKRVLVVDDIYRSGRSLHAFCGFLKNAALAGSVTVLVGTMAGKPITLSR